MVETQSLVDGELMGQYSKQFNLVLLFCILGGVMEMLEGKPNFNDSLCMFIRPGLVWPSK